MPSSSIRRAALSPSTANCMHCTTSFLFKMARTILLAAYSLSRGQARSATPATLVKPLKPYSLAPSPSSMGVQKSLTTAKPARTGNTAPRSATSSDTSTCPALVWTGNENFAGKKVDTTNLISTRTPPPNTSFLPFRNQRIQHRGNPTTITTKKIRQLTRPHPIRVRLFHRHGDRRPTPVVPLAGR